MTQIPSQNPRPGAASQTGSPTIQTIFLNASEQLTKYESRFLAGTVRLLLDAPNKADRATGERVFGFFTSNILLPYSQNKMVSRAATFARYTVIPEILNVEIDKSVTFYKAPLFYDTAMAHLLSGDTNRFEYFLAMTDEENSRMNALEAKPKFRGTTNLKDLDLGREIFKFRLEFMANLCNGSITDSPITHDFLIGTGSMKFPRIDAWRRSLDANHHVDLYRVINEIEVFVGSRMPLYEPVKDNPYIMIRLAKALANAAEWVEADLGRLQQNMIAGSLSKKLGNDPEFNELSHAAGGLKNLTGEMPPAAPIADELDKLIGEIEQAPQGIQRHCVDLPVHPMGGAGRDLHLRRVSGCA